jgi:uncharacterized protein (DUF1778 family)
MTRPLTRTAELEVRLTPEDVRKLEEAALTSGRSVGEFVVESALVHAEAILADRTRFVLDAGPWTWFLESLDAPTREVPRLRRLFEQPSVFEHDPPE